jgi:hypothetical protein
MADGRDIIEEVLEALSQVKSRIPEQSNAYSADEAAELKDILESASKWIHRHGPGLPGRRQYPAGRAGRA